MAQQKENIDWAAVKRSAKLELARRNLEDFVKQAWHVVEPGRNLIWSPYMSVICKYLERVTRGEITELVINIPPRHSKSTLVSVMWPAWQWINKPELRYIALSHAEDIAVRDNLAMRDLICSEWYQNLLSYTGGGVASWSLTEDQNQKVNYKNTKGGYRISKPIMGKITGQGADGIIIDDPHDAKDVLLGSPEQVQNLIEKPWKLYKGSLASRLNDQKKSWRVIIMQRLGLEDLAGKLIDSGVKHLVLPAEYDPNHPYLSPDDPRTMPGELLCPERFPNDVLARFKTDPVLWSGQFQQRPIPAEGRYWRSEWMHQIYEEAPWLLAPKLDEIILTADCSFKGGKGHDYAVIEARGRKGADRFVLDVYREQVDYPTFKEAFKMMCRKHPLARAKLVEDKANGSALIDDLKHEIPGIVPFNPGTKDKYERAQLGSTPLYRSGNVYLPQDKYAPWKAAYIAERLAFGAGGLHDDTIDAESQAEIYWLELDATGSILSQWGWALGLDDL